MPLDRAGLPGHHIRRDEPCRSRAVIPALRRRISASSSQARPLRRNGFGVHGASAGLFIQSVTHFRTSPAFYHAASRAVNRGSAPSCGPLRSMAHCAAFLHGEVPFSPLYDRVASKAAILYCAPAGGAVIMEADLERRGVC